MNKKKIGIIAGIAVVLAGGLFATQFLNKDNSAEGEERQTVSIVHDGGTTEVPVNPEKVVTLNYASLDILEELGLKDKIIGTAKGSLPSYLDEYAGEGVTDIGGLKEFNIETINELQPDLIIIEGRQSESYDDLQAIAPTIQLGSSSEDFVGSVERNVLALGKIFGMETEAEKKVDDVKERINAVKEQVESQNLDGLVMMVTDGSMSVYGEGSRYALLFDGFGFKASDSEIEVSNHGQSITYEYLMAKNPGYLFVVDKSNATGATEEPVAAKAILDNDIVKGTETYKNGNIVYLNGPAWYTGGAGLKAVDMMIADIENILK